MFFHTLYGALSLWYYHAGMAPGRVGECCNALNFLHFICSCCCKKHFLLSICIFATVFFAHFRVKNKQALYEEGPLNFLLSMSSRISGTPDIYPWVIAPIRIKIKSVSEKKFMYKD